MIVTLLAGCYNSDGRMELTNLEENKLNSYVKSTSHDNKNQGLGANHKDDNKTYTVTFTGKGLDSTQVLKHRNSEPKEVGFAISIDDFTFNDPDYNLLATNPIGSFNVFALGGGSTESFTLMINNESCKEVRTTPLKSLSFEMCGINITIK